MMLLVSRALIGTTMNGIISKRKLAVTVIDRIFLCIKGDEAMPEAMNQSDEHVHPFRRRNSTTSIFLSPTIM